MQLWYLGGFVPYCRNLAAGLRNRGHEVSLLVLPDSRSNLRKVTKEPFDQCVRMPRGVSRLAYHVKRVVREIDRLKPDVLMLKDSPYAMAALPYIHRAIIRTPVISSLWPNEVELGLSNPEWWDRVVSVSEFVAKAVTSRGLGSRVSVCASGVPVPSASREQQRERRRSPIHIISAGRIVVYHKRMDRLPAIGKILAERGVNYYWTVLGDGDYLPELRQELSRLGLQDRFNLKGSVPQSAVLDALEQADVLVMPSDSEGLPQALLEAMARGVVPVVSRITGSTTCAVQHGVSGFLCEPSQPAEFANAINELASNPSLRCGIGTKAAEIIARDFSLDAFTERFLAIIGEIRSRGIVRPHPLALSEVSGGRKSFRCLGFWRSLRHQTLGQMKRWVLGAKEHPI